MGGKAWSTTDLVVIGLGAALVVFFAGVTAAVAAGQTPPTPMWAAWTAVGGALIGLLVPSPGSKAAHLSAANAAQVRADNATTDAAKETASAEVAEHNKTAAGTPETKGATNLLLIVFVAMLTLGIFLAAGAIVPPQPFTESLKSVTTAVIALASASGSALIGIVAPSSDKG